MPFKYAHRVDRLIALSVLDPFTQCWNWIGCKHAINARPTITVRERGAVVKMVVTRFIVVYVHGERWRKGRQKINTGAHLCHNDQCVNPDHIKKKTQRQNNRMKKERRDAQDSAHISPLSAL